MRCVLITLSLLGTMVGVPHQAADAESRLHYQTPHLRFVLLPDYAFGIAGNQWGTFAHMAVTLHANRTVERVAVRATARGTLLIGVTAADLCSTTSVQAQDGAHHRIALRGPQKPCLVILESSPHLTILRGKPLPSPELLDDQHERQSS